MKSFKEVYEMGTDEYSDHCKQMTPGQQPVDEGYESKVSQKLDKAGIDHTWKNGELRVSKRDVKSAEKILKRMTTAGGLPNIIGEEKKKDDPHARLKKLTPTQRAALAKANREAQPKSKVSLAKMEAYKGNVGDLRYDLDLAMDELGLSRKGIKKVTKKGKNFEVRMANWMSSDKYPDFLAKQVGAKVVEWKPGGRGQINIMTLEGVEEMSAENLEEATEWKGGSKHISLTRYAAKQGFGVQIGQAEPMPGHQKRFKGAYVSIPLKDIPKLIKALQTVYKAPKGAQLGNAEESVDYSKNFHHQDPKLTSFGEFMGEGTWHVATDKASANKLGKLLKKPIILGKDGEKAQDAISFFIGDDSLFDDLNAAGMKNPKGDARPIIKKHLKKMFGL